MDLSTSQGLQQFIDCYGTRTGRWLANRLNLTGPGSEKLANLVSAYVWNARALEVCQTDQAKAAYSHACRLYIDDILASPKWYTIQRRFHLPSRAAEQLIK